MFESLNKFCSGYGSFWVKTTIRRGKENSRCECTRNFMFAICSHLKN
ncbi:hypothetical protein COF76_25685 [Bacillus wiedmannii]|nr:hypothetical protein COF76_25685 [Bacillus wiedmannii]